MGFFSWKTADTKESILNVHTGEHRTVYLLQPDGKPPIEETAYDGYGIFGGVDAYVWLADNNLNTASIRVWDGDDAVRGYGVSMGCSPNVILKYPLKFSFNKNAVYEELDASENCPNQGFFL